MNPHSGPKGPFFFGIPTPRPVARSAVDNRGRPWTAGTTLRVAHCCPPAQPGCPPLHYLGGHAPPDPSPLRGPAGPFSIFLF